MQQVLTKFFPKNFSKNFFTGVARWSTSVRYFSTLKRSLQSGNRKHGQPWVRPREPKIWSYQTGYSVYSSPARRIEYKARLTLARAKVDDGMRKWVWASLRYVKAFLFYCCCCVFSLGFPGMFLFFLRHINNTKSNWPSLAISTVTIWSLRRVRRTTTWTRMTLWQIMS